MQNHFRLRFCNVFSSLIAPEKILRWVRSLSLVLCFALLFLYLIGHSANAQAAAELKKRFEEGVSLFQQGKDPEAETRFLEILRDDPSLVLPQQYLGLLYLRSGRSEQAKTAFQEVIKKAPTFPGGYFGLALALRNQGELDQAKAFFRMAVTLAPTHYHAWLYFGQIAEGQGKADEAVEAYQKVIQHGPATSPEAGEADRRLRDLGDTPDTAKKVQAWLAEAAVRLKEKNVPEAWALYEKAAALLPRSASIRVFMGDLALQLGDAGRAETLFKEAAGIEPAAIQPLLSLAKLYEKAGRVDDAIQEYEATLLLNHDETLPEIRSAKESLFSLLDRKEIETHTQRGNFLMKQRKGEEALLELQAAAAVDLALAAVHHNLALFYDEAGRYDLALAEVEEAALLDPDSRVLHLLLGKTERELGDFRRSLAAYVKVLSLQKSRDLFSLEAESGLLQTALAMFKATLEANRPFVEGVGKRAKGERREAQLLLEEAARLSPESAPIHYHLGEIYQEQGAWERAIASLERAVELQPGFYPAWRSLARRYIEHGYGSKGIDALGRLLRLTDEQLKAMAMTREELQQEKEEAERKLEGARRKTRTLFNDAQAALAKGEKEEAISLLQTAYAEERDNLSILYSLGIVYAIEKKWQEASDAFSKILESDPLHPGALLRLGAVQEARGLLPAAGQTYRRILLQKERQDLPEYKEAVERLAGVKESLARYRIAERHEKRGLALLSELAQLAEKGRPAGTAAPEPARLRLALWDLQQAIALRPQEARYRYNLGLLYEHLNFGEEGLDRENAARAKKEPRLLEEPAAAYRAAIEIDPHYLPAYARLGQLYEWQEQTDQALTYYRAVLTEAPSPPPREVEEIKARVAALEKRFFGNVGYLFGIDSNFPLTDPPQDDSFNSLSANLVYYLARRPNLQVPLSYSTETTFYYRVQAYFSNHALSLGIQHRPVPSLSYGLTGRYQASVAKNGGLALLLSQGTASISRFGEIPTAAVFEYNYTDSSFHKSSRLDAREHRGTLTLTQAFKTREEGDFSYTFVDRRTPRSPDNSYQGHRFQLGYRRWLRPDLQFRGSTAAFLQDFLHPDSRGGRKRENTLLSYSLGLLYPWSETTTLFIDYRWQRNRSNLGPAVLDEIDILLGRNTALGDYTKRVLSAGVTVAF